ncbi:MAG: dTDP-4-dehydrorhamnose reductase [Theionarchaea archaeon]|nr:dTDP-4-dehydrorhamnose reductase [Theionarchaea archaeon]MBU7020377.1 dTDP-4-dehydrorhamnose reductase [Theionarchaea archaeon]
MITGHTGLLGSKILAKSRFQTYPDRRIDITTPEIIHYIQEVAPDMVIHCAAFTNVDLCETQKDKAWLTNVTGTENVVTACASLHAKLVYISTDFVFDGTGKMYTEEDTPNPINYYGMTKLEGERIVQEMDDSLIVRTSVLYGWHHHLNFVTWVLSQLQSEKHIRIVTDQYTCPTLADNFAEVLLDLCKKDVMGLYHVTGTERITRYDFAREIANIFGLDDSFMTPVRSEDLAQKAPRPRDSSLSTQKIKAIIDTPLLSVKEGLQEMKKVSQ